MRSYKKILTTTALLLALTTIVTASPAELTLFPEESDTRIDSFTSYQLEIENVGPVEDVYTLKSNRPAEITIAPTRVPEEGNLAPGETKTVNIWYNPREDAKEGRQSFDITATSRASGDKYTTTGYVNVIFDHKVSLAADTTQTACLNEEAVYEIEVTNDGIQKDEFQITTDYGELSETQLQLEAGETRTITLTASESEEVTENFNINAASKSASYATDTLNMEFNTETCYDSETSITPEEQDVAAYTEAEYEINIDNTGTRTENFRIESNTGELSQTQLEIPSTQTGTTTLTKTPTELGTETIEVQTESLTLSETTSTATAEMNVYNGMDLDLEFAEDEAIVCRGESTTTDLEIENTGEAEETYELEETDGELSQTETTLEPGQKEQLELELDASDYEDGTHEVEVEGTATTFDEPTETATTEFTVENCWDLEMDAVPEVASAGENRSTVYEIRLENTGTKTNTYQISHQGPEWVSISPTTQEVEPGDKAISYMYAGAPFQKKGEVDITVTAVGTEVERTKTVKLLVDKELEEAIEDRTRRDGITGAFTQRTGNLVSSITQADNATRLLIAIFVGISITSIILYREW